MQRLYNSKGKHIANFVNKQLYNPRGKNIGHYREREEIFIDMKGHYLGEILYDDRLMYNNNSPHKLVNFGIYGTHGNIGNYGNPGNKGKIGIQGGFRDVEI
ncbi:hypothetical protein [Bacillus subtilis]|uniref:hypothetical protein n=1 Tax=Bacillus subtilis TaxID=1423 RepID=UPI001EDF7715|nr:hypothetical protein [Bacillus subtilis]MCG3227893.1 hypothetical protein [Bacillus subtilis]MEC1961263.1 hypothetical protein [Bacillus subtilis]